MEIKQIQPLPQSQSPCPFCGKAHPLKRICRERLEALAQSQTTEHAALPPWPRQGGAQSMAWRDETRQCALDECRAAFQPKREGQQFCCETHAATVRKRRSRDRSRPLSAVPEKPCHGFLEHRARSTETPAPYFNPHGPTPGALQGDDYPLEYYHDGYPKLPACLDRRPKPLLEEAACWPSPRFDRRLGLLCRRRQICEDPPQLFDLL
jgi:hypothetical protein